MTLVSGLVSVAADSVLPADRLVNTVHFNTGFDLLNPVGGTDFNTLATDLAALWATNLWPTGAAREVDVKLYDLDDAKPRPVRAHHVNNVGAAPASVINRELSLCLSFYADRNLPRQRGRLYIPAVVFAPAGAVRPPQQWADRLLNLADALSGLGGSNVDWCVYSRTDNVHRKVTHAWVDNEWDTVRSRGLKSDTRWQRDVSG